MTATMQDEQTDKNHEAPKPRDRNRRKTRRGPRKTTRSHARKPAANSTAAAPTRSPEEYQSLVVSALGPKLRQIADHDNWNSDLRELVCDYVKSLTSPDGDASVPDGLQNTRVIWKVGKTFIAACAEVGVPRNTLAGQRRKLYPRRRRS